MATIWSKAPWCMNDWGEPVSRRARQRNGDVVEAPLASDVNVVNVSSSIVTVPLTKSGPCSVLRPCQYVDRMSKVPLAHGRRAPSL